MKEGGNTVQIGKLRLTAIREKRSKTRDPKCLPALGLLLAHLTVVSPNAQKKWLLPSGSRVLGLDFGP